MTASTWNGRRGPVLLGPTEHRVARWLADMTRSGRVTIRTVDLAASTHVERSEAYRITARLRTLGLFGIENDRGGTRGGRRYWRTGIEHDGPGLNATRHRDAWARLVGWARARRETARARLDAIRHHTSAALSPEPRRIDEPADRPAHTAAGSSFLDRLRRNGLRPELVEDFAR